MAVHTCHWPGCGQPVPQSRWGCRRHWIMLPSSLRARIWMHYKPGQEITKTPTPEYIQAAKDVQQWIADRKAATK